MSKHVDLSEEYDAIAAASRAHDEKEAQKLVKKLRKDHPTIFDGEALHFALAMEERGASRHFDEEAQEWTFRFPS